MFRNVMSMSRTEQMRILERDNFTVPYLNSILANLSKPGTANICNSVVANIYGIKVKEKVFVSC